MADGHGAAAVPTLEGGRPAPTSCDTLVPMEQRRVGYVCSLERVQDTFQKCPAPDYGSSGFSKELRRRAQTQRLARSHSRLYCKRCTRTLAGTNRPGILFPGLSRPQTIRAMAHGHRPACPQPIHIGGLVQDGISRIHPASVTHGRMGGVNRLDGRLSPHTDASPVLEIHPVCPRGRGVRVSNPPLRPGGSTIRFHPSDEIGIGVLPSRGTTVPRLPGRLSLPCSNTRELSKTGRVNNVSNTLSGFLDQHQEIRIDSLSGIHIPGSVVQSGTRYGLPCPSQVSDIPSASRETDGTINCVSAGSPQATRPHGILRATPSRRESSQKGVADAVDNEVGLQPLGQTYPSHDVVQNRGRELARGRIPRAIQSSPQPQSHANAVHRRLQHRLGRSPQQSPSIGQMVCGPQRSTYQLSRDGGCPSSSECLRGITEGPGDAPQDGQLDSCRLHKQRGGGSFPGPLQTINTDTAKGVGRERSPDSQAHSRESQCSGGLSQQEKHNSPDRMDYSSGHDKWDLQSMGETPHRLVCHQAKQKITNFRVPGTRSTSRERRRSHVRLDGTGGLCFSSAGSSGNSPQKDPTGRSSGDSAGTKLASSLMVSPVTVSPHRDSSKDSSKTRPLDTASISVETSEAGSLQATRLETIQQSLRKKGFSERVSSCISRSRRTSTERIYQSHWRCWVDWAERRKVDPSDPLVQQLCDFLLFLIQEKKFSQGTVKSYRSAICTTIRQSGGPDLASNPILRELVNSLKINAPKSAPRVPQWDVYLVLEALKGPPFEPPTTCDLAHWSYKTAFLLALATAKRRSELHAIEFKATRWEKNEVQLFLLPEFVAKNQRPGEAFPPIVVPSLAHTLRHEDRNRTLCPHRALKWYLEKSKHHRSAQRRLFISFSKPGKEISAPTLSRWIVKAVTIAMELNGKLPCNENTPRAHEVRAIATSLAITRSISMENILRAAFWRNESTFLRFYLRDMSHDMDGKVRLPMVAAQHILS